MLTVYLGGKIEAILRMTLALLDAFGYRSAWLTS